jgi:phosphate transport system substrate-binding protein
MFNNKTLLVLSSQKTNPFNKGEQSVMKRFGLQLSAFIMVMIFTVSVAIAGNVDLWGSTTCQKRFLEPGAKPLKDATGVDIKVFGVGTGKGMLALLDGKTNVAMTSNDLAGTIKSAKDVLKKEGKSEARIPANLQFHEITTDIIVPIVNKDNPVESLSWAQLADLNTGKITNWKDVGGSDMPVQVVTSHAGSSTKAVFQELVMKKAGYSAGAIEVNSTRLEINEVSKAPGGIGAVSAGFFHLNPGRTKIVKTETVSRPLALITIGNPAPDVQKIIDFFRSAEGRKYILD